MRRFTDSFSSSVDANRDLLRAAERGDADAAVLALRAGADLETRNDRCQTPLLLAAANDHNPVARLLVGLGADRTALDHARSKGYTNIIRTLENG